MVKVGMMLKQIFSTDDIGINAFYLKHKIARYKLRMLLEIDLEIHLLHETFFLNNQSFCTI